MYVLLGLSLLQNQREEQMVHMKWRLEKVLGVVVEKKVTLGQFLNLHMVKPKKYDHFLLGGQVIKFFRFCELVGVKSLFN